MVRRINGDAEVVAAFDAHSRRRAGHARRARTRRLDRRRAAPRRRMDRTASGWRPRVTTPAIDELLDRAHRAGALAGKVCGAGGGGCLFCLVDPDRQAAVSSALADGGASVLPCDDRTGRTQRSSGADHGSPRRDQEALLHRDQGDDSARPRARRRAAQDNCPRKTTASARRSTWTACRRCGRSGRKAAGGESDGRRARVAPA